MNIEKLPKLPPVEIGYIVDSSLPIIPLVMDVEFSGCAAVHSHPRGQLIYASRGVMRIFCENESWIVPPYQAVWVPPNIKHNVFFPEKVTLRNLFIDQSLTDNLPQKCTVLKISELLHQLILKVSIIEDNYQKDSSIYRLMMVVIDELTEALPTELGLPTGTDQRLLKVMNILLKNIQDNRNLESLGKLAGASSRTLSRLFIKETGLSFGTWRRRLRLQEAIKLLDKGHSVTEVAFELGYKSPSAFIEMFRHALGESPMNFLKNK